MMSIKNESLSSKNKNNLECGYLIQQQLEMVNINFGEIMNKINESRIKVASIRDKLVHRIKTAEDKHNPEKSKCLLEFGSFIYVH